MLLMGRRNRHALKALYYFCRAVDDAVDEVPTKQEAAQNLAFWRHELEVIYTGQSPSHAVMQRLETAIRQFKLPRQPFEDFFKGMEFDCAEKVEIKTESELERYCYCVAGTVGLQAMHIFEVRGERAESFAMALGQALQLTNILRDVKKDAAINRVYIPSEWRGDKLSKLISKAEARFDEVAILQKSLPSRALLPALLMRDIYYWKLQQLKQQKPVKPLPLGVYFKLAGRGIRYYLS